MWPMLDDRNETISTHQIDGVGIWDHTSMDQLDDAAPRSRTRTGRVAASAAS